MTNGILPHEESDIFHADTKEIYREYYSRGLFEVVFVALGYNEKLFNQAFSFMPWLAIPHDDHQTRFLLGNKFSIPSTSLVLGVLFDVHGIVLLDFCATMFRYYGPEGFPFSNEKIAEIHQADATLLKQLFSLKKIPLENILGDFIFSSEEKKVRTSDLENHIVGLHFFDASEYDDCSPHVLLNTWNALKDDPSKKFAIVSINQVRFPLSIFKDMYQQRYKDIPWYRLPSDGRRLSRIFNIKSYTGRLIIINPDRYQPFNYFALDALEMYGIQAFPFTLERVLEIEKKKQQDLKLCELLPPSTPLRRGFSNCCKVCHTRFNVFTMARTCLPTNVCALVVLKLI